MTFFQTARKIAFPLAALLAVFVFASAAVACPTCKDSLAGDPAQQRMVAGYFYSILFMMSMPFLILGGFGSCVYVAVRRSRKENDSESEHPTHIQGS